MGAQEHRGETRRTRDAEGTADAGAAALCHRVAEHGQRLPDIGRVALAARRQRYPLADALQEIEAEIAFQQPQLVAYRAAGEVQFVSGTPDAAVAGETVESAQCLCGWNSQEVNRICTNRENISLFDEPLHCFLCGMDKPVATSAQETALACLDGIQPLLSAWTRTIFDFG